jgi:hypothetical protein
MNIRIVCYEDVNKWIIGKFALKLQENLLAIGHQVSISDEIDKSADINHHIIYSGYEFQAEGNHSLMITHIDSSTKINLLKKQLLTAAMGICMSRETLEYLVNLGVPRNKLCYINPAHDGVIQPRTSIIGITCRVQEDGRKREYFLGKLAKIIDPELFSFSIMGDGWDEQVQILEKSGFKVNYINHFDYAKYIQLIPSLDYYLYMGQDEGQMGFIDAVTAGVPTIVTRQGYHLDASDGLTYGFDSFEDLINCFTEISKQKKRHIDSVKYWTWKDYTIKHLEIWEYMISPKNDGGFKKRENKYVDGLGSVHLFDNNKITRNRVKALSDSLKLYYGRFRHAYFFRLNKYKKTRKNQQ